MNKQLVFAVYDSGVSTFFTPFCAPSIRDAKDSFTRVCDDPNTSICRHPEDYSLMELGTFDSTLGRFENATAPVNHGLATVFKQRPQEDNTLPFAKGAN